jgi:hypothetical protein
MFRSVADIRKFISLTSLYQLQTGFGLLDETPDRWTKFKAAIESKYSVAVLQTASDSPCLPELQKDAPENVKYKVLFCGRHGQGWHNFGAEKYDPVVSPFGILWAA